MTPFDVVLVPFPFADLSAAKRRPCLVLAGFQPRSMPQHVILCMMTSQVEGPRFPYDCEITELAAAGLPKPTLARVCKMVTLDSTLIVKKLGRLAQTDQETVRARLRELLPLE